MSNTNPYNYNLPVAAEMFYGRQQDVADVVNALCQTPGDSVALIGGRRMGKTSLLEAVKRSLEAATADDSLLCVPIFLDLSGAGLTSEVDFFYGVAQEVEFALSAYVDKPLAPFALAERQSPTLVFRKLLQAWGRAVMAQQGRRLRLILLLDECEQIVAHTWSAALYGSLRSLLVGETTRSLLKVVMAGSHRFLRQVYERGSPLNNILVYHKLAVLPEAVSHDLITQPTQGQLSPDVVAMVKQQGGGHPFLTQYLLYQLWQEGISTVTAETVGNIAADFPRQRNDFWSWMSGLGETGQRVYAVLNQQSSPMAEADLRLHLQPLPPDLVQALDGLSYHGLIVYDSSQHQSQTAGRMFQDWFAHYGFLTDNHAIPKDLSCFRELITEHFNLDELRTLCFDLEVDYEELSGTTKGEKVRELIAYCQRRENGLLAELASRCRLERPQVDWG